MVNYYFRISKKSEFSIEEMPLAVDNRDGYLFTFWPSPGDH